MRGGTNAGVLVSALVLAVVLAAVGARAGEKGAVDFSQMASVELGGGASSTRVYALAAARQLGAGELAAGIGVPSGASRGFGFARRAGNASDEVESLRLGVQLADFELALEAGDAEKARAVGLALLERLSRLGAPVELVASLGTLVSGLQDEASARAAARYGLSVWRPFLNRFVDAGGSVALFRAGAAAEVVALAGRGELTPQRLELVRSVVQEQAFAQLAGVQNLPEDVRGALQRLAELSQRAQWAEREWRAAVEAAQQLRASLLG